jgi:hypothetical protein
MKIKRQSPQGLPRVSGFKTYPPPHDPLVFALSLMQTRLLCRECRKHLFTGALAGQKDGVHFMLRIFRHVVHVLERRLHVLVGRRLGLVSGDLKRRRE